MRSVPRRQSSTDNPWAVAEKDSKTLPRMNGSNPRNLQISARSRRLRSRPWSGGGGFLLPPQRSCDRLQRLNWTDPSMHRAPRSWAHKECEWKRGEDLWTGGTRTFHRTGGSRFWEHRRSVRSWDRKGRHLLRPRRCLPLTPPRQPHLASLGQVRKWSRVNPRGPPRRSAVDFLAWFKTG